MRKLRWVLIALAGGGLFLAGVGYERGWAARAPGAAGAGAGRRILYYVDPMHPGYRSDRPGVAPDCGMKLQPVYEDGGAAGGGVKAEAAPAGTLNISADKQQLIGVQYGYPEMSAEEGTLRAVGKVAYDETRLTRIHAKVPGWIEKVYAAFTGAEVKAGQPLLTIYSPEMLASEQEYLLALKARGILSRSTVREAGTESISLVEAARERLELWDLSGEQIREIEASGKPVRTVTLNSPASGFVIARGAFPGQRITPETELYEVADLSRVWIMADVYEADLDKVRMGQRAVVSLPMENGRRMGARVSYIQPDVEAATRTVKVRLEAANAGLRLKPEMFVDVDFPVSGARRLTVPADAVLDGGVSKTVFVDRGGGNLEPRSVETGDRFGDRVEIRAGLKPGERIVTSGTFLIDSESRLRPALNAMKAQRGGAGAAMDQPKMPGMEH